MKIRVISILALLLSISPNSYATVNLSFSEPSLNGDKLMLAVAVSGLEDTSLSTFDMTIGFDPGHLRFTGAQFGDPVYGNQLDLSDFGSNETLALPLSDGEVNIFELSFDTAADLNAFQLDSFTLAMLEFGLLKPGSSRVEILPGVLLGDADGNPLAASISSTEISTVPLPAAFWMMASGLLLLHYRRRAG